MGRERVSGSIAGVISLNDTHTHGHEGEVSSGSQGNSELTNVGLRA